MLSRCSCRYVTMFGNSCDSGTSSGALEGNGVLAAKAPVVAAANVAMTSVFAKRFMAIPFLIDRTPASSLIPEGVRGGSGDWVCFNLRDQDKGWRVSPC